MATKRIVPPEKYTREYFLSDNVEGYQEFQEGLLSQVKQKQLEMLALTEGTTLLEVGFGRGEFLYHCAKRGAHVAGIDYSKDALEIAQGTLRKFPNADLRCADCKALPFADNSFARVFSGDVIEHLDIEDGSVMLQEMYRVLQPNGFMLVHTSPNVVFTRFIYPLVKPLLKLVHKPTIEVLEEHMEVSSDVHVREYNLWSLKKVARMAGLSNVEVWIDRDILRSGKHRHTQALIKTPLAGFVGFLSRFAVVRFLLGNDLYLRCSKK